MFCAPFKALTLTWLCGRVTRGSRGGPPDMPIADKPRHAHRSLLTRSTPHPAHTSPAKPRFAALRPISRHPRQNPPPKPGGGAGSRPRAVGFDRGGQAGRAGQGRARPGMSGGDSTPRNFGCMALWGSAHPQICSDTHASKAFFGVVPGNDVSLSAAVQLVLTMKTGHLHGPPLSPPPSKIFKSVGTSTPAASIHSWGI